MDDGGGLCAEALKGEGTRARVLEACKKKRVELKVLFYTLAGGDGELTLEELSAGLEEALEDQAEEWGFTAAAGGCPLTFFLSSFFFFVHSFIRVYSLNKTSRGDSTILRGRVTGVELYAYYTREAYFNHTVSYRW